MLLAINEFLQKHASAEFAVFGPLSTLRVPLPGTGLEECVGFLGARFIFCGRGGTICDRDKIQIGFANALVDHGVIILGGPVASDDEEDIALLAVEAPDEAALRSLFDSDPWIAHQVFRIKAVRPWTIWLDGRSRAAQPAAD